MVLAPQKILCEGLRAEPLHFPCNMRSFMSSTSYALRKKSFCLHFFFIALSRKKPVFNVVVPGPCYGLYS